MSAAEDKVLAYEEALEAFDPVFGIEVHVELNTKTKMFCGCANEFGGEPNTQTCPVCLGLPGSMPVTNEKAVESAIRLGLALGCSIRESSRFARKNYFYPDLAKDYQISQYDEPTSYEGSLDVVLDDGTSVTIGIERAHMEEDAGKNTHVGGSGGIQGANHSLVDYNRGGVPLVEIVTKPITGTGPRTAEVARAYVATIRDLVRALGISDGRMEQGSLRADVNLSLRAKAAPGEDQNAIPFGKRSETKNVNSLRAIERSIHHEAGRQAALLSAGKPVVQETRHWHEDTNSTTPGRSKEEAEDYRYFPEPDLSARPALARVGRGAARDHPRTPGKAARAPPDGLGLHRPGDARRGRGRRRWTHRGDGRGRRRSPGGAQVVDGRAGADGQRAGRRARGACRVDPRGRRRAPDARRHRARSTTSSRARRSLACSPGKGRPPWWWRRAASPSSPTTPRSRRPSMRRSRPTPMCSPRSRTARSLRPAPSWGQ